MKTFIASCRIQISFACILSQVSAGMYQLITRLFHAGPGILLVNIATSLLAEQKLGLELQVLPVVGAVHSGGVGK